MLTYDQGHPSIIPSIKEPLYVTFSSTLIHISVSLTKAQRSEEQNKYNTCRNCYQLKHTKHHWKIKYKRYVPYCVWNIKCIIAERGKAKEYFVLFDLMPVNNVRSLKGHPTDNIFLWVYGTKFIQAQSNCTFIHFILPRSLRISGPTQWRADFLASSQTTTPSCTSWTVL